MLNSLNLSRVYIGHAWKTFFIGKIVCTTKILQVALNAMKEKII